MTRAAAPELPAAGFKPAEALDPALLRFIEALARAHADEDYAAELETGATATTQTETLA